MGRDAAPRRGCGQRLAAVGGQQAAQAVCRQRRHARRPARRARSPRARDCGRIARRPRSRSACQCSRLRSRCFASSLTTERSASTGTMRVTPSSVAFCTMRSMRSPRAMPCSSVICERRLALDGVCAPARAPAPSCRCARRARRRIRRPAPLNKREWRARLEAQHARQMFARLRGQHDLGAVGERAGHVDSRQAHASSMPSVATRASSSISSGAMT